MAPDAGGALECPDCHSKLSPLRTKMNVIADACPQGHGIFLEPKDVLEIVDIPTSQRIRKIIRGAAKAAARCPNCNEELHAGTINGVNTRGCANCGALWFNNDDLQAHVREVRKRAYGERSMAARIEVVRDAAAFYPGEVVAGILTDFQLEQG